MHTVASLLHFVMLQPFAKIVYIHCFFSFALSAVRPYIDRCGPVQIYDQLNLPQMDSNGPMV